LPVRNFPTNLVYPLTLRVGILITGRRKPFRPIKYNFMGSETLPSAFYVLYDESSLPFYSTMGILMHNPSYCLVLWDLSHRNQYHDRADPQKSGSAEGDSSGKQHAVWDFAPYMDLLADLLSQRK